MTTSSRSMRATELPVILSRSASRTCDNPISLRTALSSLPVIIRDVYDYRDPSQTNFLPLIMTPSIVVALWLKFLGVAALSYCRQISLCL
jgi:hypothetical protein